LAALVLLPASVHAQATRTWVSGVGDDVNPCSRTAPCKTFAGAISKTAIGGEIDALDPGGFGALTITKSITIDGAGTLASVLASGVNGIIVNCTGGVAGTQASDCVVIIRNLTINGTGTSVGLSGINFIAGASLTVEDTLIQNFGTAGINFHPSGNAKLYVNNTTVDRAGDGILVSPSGGLAKASISHSRAFNNPNAGLKAVNNAVVTVRDFDASGNNNGFIAVGVSATPMLDIDACQASNNGNAGVAAGCGAGIAGVRMSNCIVSGNANGLLADPGHGTILSFANNKIVDNGTNGSPNGTLALQ